MKKALLTAAAVATVGTAGLMSANSASAQTTGDSLVDRLASRFNLSSDEVQQVVDEHRDERRAERAEQREEALQAKVDEGVITQAQLDLLQEKTDELKAQKEELKEQDLSREEIRAALSEAREEFQAWAAENGIDLDTLRPDKGERSQRGNRGQFRQDQSNSESQTEVQPASQIF